MANEVKLTYDGSDYIVKCTGVKIGYNPLVYSKPNANWIYPVEMQTQGIENPIYTLENVMLIDSASHLSSSLLLDMMTNQYDGTNGITLTVNYGREVDRLWTGIDGTTTAIPVVIRPFTINIPVEDVYNGDSSFYLPGFNLVLQETA